MVTNLSVSACAVSLGDRNWSAEGMDVKAIVKSDELSFDVVIIGRISLDTDAQPLDTESAYFACSSLTGTSEMEVHCE